MTRKIGATIPTQHPAMKQVAKSWRNLRTRALKKDEKDMAGTVELRDIASSITDQPDPIQLAKSQLKAEKKLVDARRKLDEKRIDAQIQFETDLQLQKEKNQFEREKLELKKQQMEEREKAKREIDAEKEKVKQELEAKKEKAKQEQSQSSTSSVGHDRQKKASVAPSQGGATTGPEALLMALRNLDLDALEKDSRDVIRAGVKTKRPLAVQRLQYLAGLKRNGMTPEDLMITKVPVLPPSFRPYSAGETLIPGDSNLLYKDLLETRNAYQQVRESLGEELSADARLALYDAVKASYGFGDPVSPKLRERGVSGTLQTILGRSPKYSVVQRRLLSKTQDNVGRSTIIPDPDLSIDEVGLPEEMAWNVYQPFIIRRLVKQQGYRPAEAIKAFHDRTDLAKQHMLKEMPERPVLVSRSPAWHKHNVMALFPKLTKGNAIKIPPMITTAYNADFDGDQMNIHVPATDKAVTEAREKLLPSRMIFSARDPDRVVNTPKHEMVLGLYNAKQRPSGVAHQFADKKSALSAILSGRVNINDDVNIGGMPLASGT